MICTMSKHAAEAKGCSDALFMDWEGYVAEATGANIVRVAAGAPLKQIAANAGLNGGVVTEKVENLPAGEGLNALFTPDWSALRDYKVWMAALGQIFFSLSVGFGIMLTYSSYLRRRRSNLVGTGLVAGFANSAFELLAGIGVFATLGFMAGAQGVGVDELKNITLPGGHFRTDIALPAVRGAISVDA